MELIKFGELPPADRYRLTVENLIPRPIGWVMTENNGILNLAPFSYFSGVSSRPPLLSLSIGRRKKGVEEPKDTYRNLLETKKGVVMIPDYSQLEWVEQTGQVLPATRSEVEEFQIPVERPLPDYPPIVKGVPRAFFCTLYGTFDRPELATVPFFLKIEYFYTTGEPFTPIARLGTGYQPLQG